MDEIHDRPLSLVTDSTKQSEIKSEQASTPIRYPPPTVLTEITRHAYDTSEMQLGIDTDYRIKNIENNSVFDDANTSNRRDFNSHQRPEVYQQDQRCFKDSNQYLNNSHHQYCNETTSAEHVVSDPYLLGTSHTGNMNYNSVMSNYETSTTFYPRESILQQNRQHLKQERFTEKNTVADEYSVVKAIDRNSPVNYGSGQHAEEPLQVTRSTDLNCVNQNVGTIVGGRLGSIANVTSLSSLNRPCLNLSHNRSHEKSSHMVHCLSRQIDNISPTTNRNQQTHNFIESEINQPVPLVNYSVRKNIPTKLPSCVEQLSPSTFNGHPMVQELQKIHDMSGYQEVCSGKIPNIFQSNSLENYLGLASSELQKSKTNTNFEHGELCYDTAVSIVKHINNFGEVENSTGSLLSSKRNIPKKRFHMDTSALNVMNFDQQFHGLCKQTDSNNELSPLAIETQSSLTISDTIYKSDRVESNSRNKVVEHNEADNEMKQKSLTSETSETEVDGNENRNVLKLNKTDKGCREIELKIGQDSSLLSSLRFAGGENLSDVSEEQIREIQRIAAKILDRPVSVTWAADKEKTRSPEQEVKVDSITTDSPVVSIKAPGRKPCRKKPLSQVIDMLNQESEQVSREPATEIEVQTIVIKREDDDWTITEPEPKSRPTRKTSSLVVRLKREKVKLARKTSKKKVQKDHGESGMTRAGFDDPDYKIEMRSFNLRNKKKLISKARKTKVKKKDEVSSFTCEVCGKEFGAKSTLRLHKIIHVPTRPHVCPECSKAFRHKGNLLKHRQSHTGVRPHICNYCNKGYSSRYALKIHTRKHTGERPFDCTVCEKKFYTKNCLLAHINIHSGKKNIVCDICGKLFYNQANLYLHMRTHSGERPFLCTMCHMSFAQKVNLTNHMRTHTGEKPFQCETCGHSFAQLSTLQIHIRTHTGEKPFVCVACGKTYSTRGGLRMHKKIHGGIKQFKCTYCEKCFVDKSNLKKHVRIHTGEKPFMCDVCGRYFNQSSALRTHWKTHPEITSDTKRKPFRVMPPDALQSSFGVTGQQLVNLY